MRKLGKKNHEMKQTVEAYGCGCSDYAVCSNCSNGYSHNSINSAAYAGVLASIAVQS